MNKPSSQEVMGMSDTNENNSENEKKNSIFKISKDYIGIVSLLVAGVAFVLRGIWYFYNYGYFVAFNIDDIYLIVDNDNSIYAVLGWIGLSIIYIFINCCSYFFIFESRDGVFKKIVEIFIALAYEFVNFIFIVGVLSNNGDISAIIMYFGANDLGSICIDFIVVSALLNSLTISMCIAYIIIVKFRKKNMKFTLGRVIESLKDIKVNDIADYLICIFSILIMIAVLGGLLFISSISDANSKVNFKVIESIKDTLENNEDDKYLFIDDNGAIKQYEVILYETNEYYIVAPLYNQNDTVLKDTNQQKVIKKENIDTYYYEDINNILVKNTNEEGQTNTELNLETDKSEVDFDMDFSAKEGITFIISIIGACAWLPILIDKFRKPKIECKILKNDWLETANYIYNVPFGNGVQKVINGTVFVMMFRCISLNNDFIISKFKVKVKFESMKDELDADVHFSSNFTVKNIGKEFFSDIGMNILYCPVLKKDIVYDLETHFIVEANKTDVEYVKFIFEKEKGKPYIVTINKDDFKFAHKTFV